MMKNKKGITLTELLVAIIIMAVLAGFVVARFSGQNERAVVSEAVGMLSAIRQAEVAYELEHGAYTGTLANLDVEVTESAFSYSAAVADGTATATREDVGTGACVNKTITLTVGGAFGGTHPYGPNPDNGSTC